jgi:hypothetical protein
VTLVQKFAYNAYAHKNPMLLLAVLLAIIGMQLLGMGLLAELQVRTYHESQQKPIYLVAEEVNASPVSARGSVATGSEREPAAAGAERSWTGVRGT